MPLWHSMETILMSYWLSTNKAYAYINRNSFNVTMALTTNSFNAIMALNGNSSNAFLVLIWEVYILMIRNRESLNTIMVLN